MPNVPRLFVQSKVKAPCKDCPDRFVGCHSTCEKYIQFKKDSLSEFNKRRDAYKGERALEDYDIRKFQRILKK